MNNQGFLRRHFGKDNDEREQAETGIALNKAQIKSLKDSGDRADTANLIAFLSVVVAIVGIIVSIVVIKQSESLEQRIQTLEQKSNFSKQP